MGAATSVAEAQLKGEDPLEEWHWHCPCPLSLSVISYQYQYQWQLYISIKLSILILSYHNISHISYIIYHKIILSYQFSSSEYISQSQSLSLSLSIRIRLSVPSAGSWRSATATTGSPGWIISIDRIKNWSRKVVVGERVSQSVNDDLIIFDLDLDFDLDVFGDCSGLLWIGCHWPLANCRLTWTVDLTHLTGLTPLPNLMPTRTRTQHDTTDAIHYGTAADRVMSHAIVAIVLRLSHAHTESIRLRLNPIHRQALTALTLTDRHWSLTSLIIDHWF